MIKNIRYFGILITLGLLIFLSISSPVVPTTASPTPTEVSRARTTEIALDMQAGKSDGILLLGILIFLFIAVPILVRYRDLRT